jgi:trans-aconitate methyltransferase
MKHDNGVFSGCERFFRPGYAANLVAGWIPALDGVGAKLSAGARVADVGCGHGASTTLIARAFPNSNFTGSDYHEGPIIQARKRVADAGLVGQVRFDVASAQTFQRRPL